MKVALLIAGYLRTYETNIEYIKREILDKFKNVDVFLHITKDENAEDKYLNLIDEDDVKAIIKALEPVSTIIEGNTHFSDDKSYNNLINHWNKLYKLNELKCLREADNNEKYDLVIRYRLDLNILTNDIFNLKSGAVFLPKDSKMDKSRLKNVSDGYLCDAFAFGDSETMDKYFNIYEKIHELATNHGIVSETLLYNYLNSSKIDYELLDMEFQFTLSKCNVFAICGDSGSGKSTLSNLLQNSFSDAFKLECDRYHKWERTHENWKEITHLNPNANYITKMHEDIFNLRLGNEVFQVDYDHNTGKFTEKQLINPSNNLIVCGLHTLYQPDKNKNMLYDLKIYMDTDVNLKKRWKIIRDVKERGYSLEKVLDSMKKREDDFLNYIEPQKDAADLVIRFFSKDSFDPTDIDFEPSISLAITISNTINVGRILRVFDINGVNYSVEQSNGKITVVFDKYVELNNIDETIRKTNSFYDYILYFIFNMGLTNI